MGGHRGARSVALLVALAAAASGCLGAPASSGPGDGDGDGDGDGNDVGEGDAGVPGEPDASWCPVVVSNAFDTADWLDDLDPAAFVERAAGWTRVRAVPSPDVYAYGDLHTDMQAPLDGATLTVEVQGTIVSVIGEVGIAWQNAPTDSYQLEVANGSLRAIRRTASSEQVVCDSTCPDYSAIEHVRLRLREQGGTVLYQSASEAGEWIDIGSAPAADLPYSVYLYASATGPGSGDLTAVGVEWRACEE